jgi:phosphoglycolate phosphatase
MKIGILFDLDGTLLDTLQDLTDSVNYALAQFDCPPRTPADVRRFLGNGAKQLIALSLP